LTKRQTFNTDWPELGLIRAD